MERQKASLPEVIRYPDPAHWASLCRRPASGTDHDAQVRAILNKVHSEGDRAVHSFTTQFDGVHSETLFIEVENSVTDRVPADLRAAIDIAFQNISLFHQKQTRKAYRVETMPGVTCWRKAVPVSRVGLYIPGGSAPLFSTLLMLGIPARIAGCPEIVLCTPPGSDGTVPAVIQYVAQLLHIPKIYTVGGAQAIAAMAYGTETIPRVDKIFGPGNTFVTTAKQLVQHEGIAIDMPAGPSEVLVIADATSNPAFIAADLLSQAEHGPDSQVVLVTDAEDLIPAVLDALAVQLSTLPRKEIADQALAQSKVFLVHDLEEAIALSNTYAPEHLILAVEDASGLAEKVVHAGSVFLGQYSCESAGDYASGTNHTLPTNGYARSYSGVSVDSFVNQITFQEITQDGLCNIGPAIEILAAAEQLEAHRRAVSIRLQTLSPEVQTAHFNIKDLARPNVRSLKPYSSARDEFKGEASVWLDANESPFNTHLNRYPDSRHTLLRNKLAEVKGVRAEQIFTGNGSDEAIDLLIRAFCTPGEDAILIFEPTYGVYEVFAHIHDVEVIRVPLDSQTFQLPKVIPGLHRAKLVFICSPNNPTGNLITREDILALTRQTKGLVVVDEAYMDFAAQASLLPEVDKVKNLVVLQTLSKAWGLAGIRLGMAFGHPESIEVLDKIKPPYNINTLTYAAALKALDDKSQRTEHVALLLAERERLLQELERLPQVRKVYPSDANFLLVQFDDAREVFEKLIRTGIVVRDRTTAVENCLRITVGTPAENILLLNTLKNILG